MSVKLVDDNGRWYLDDFAKATNICAALLADMEIFVLADTLEFDPRIMESVLFEEWHLFQLKKSL